MKKVIAFSFGQTSGRMLRMLMDQNPTTFDRDYIIIFCNTGKEHDKTLDFGRAVEKNWGIKIHWLEYHRVPAIVVPAEIFPEGRRRTNHQKKQEQKEDCHWVKEVNYETAKRRFDKDGGPFDELLRWMSTIPNVRSRACSGFLKIRTMRRWLYGQGHNWVEDYIGIRADEVDRATEILCREDEYQWRVKFPLIDAKQRKADVDQWWNKQPFKLEIPNYMGNCDLCYLKARWKRVAILRAEPQAAVWWADWEKEKQLVGREAPQWDKTASIQNLLNEASHPEFNFGTSVDRMRQEQDIPCSCAVGGSREWEEEE